MSSDAKVPGARTKATRPGGRKILVPAQARARRYFRRKFSRTKLRPPFASNGRDGLPAVPNPCPCTSAPATTSAPNKKAHAQNYPPRAQAPAWARTCPRSSSFPRRHLCSWTPCPPQTKLHRQVTQGGSVNIIAAPSAEKRHRRDMSIEQALKIDPAPEERHVSDWGSLACRSSGAGTAFSLQHL